MPIGQPVRAEGWIVRAGVDWSTRPAGSSPATATVLATAEGAYVAADEARKRELQARYGYRARAARDATDGLPEPVDG